MSLSPCMKLEVELGNFLVSKAKEIKDGSFDKSSLNPFEEKIVQFRNQYKNQVDQHVLDTCSEIIKRFKGTDFPAPRKRF